MIFISRHLSDSSPLRAWVASQGDTIDDRSLLTFAPVAFTPPGDAHWWFFYSPRAVQYAGAIPPTVRTAAIGGTTAASLYRHAGRVDFCGTGEPRAVAEEFLAVAEGQRVFFPRARQSRRSVQMLLADRVTVLDAICYDNQPVPPTAAIVADTYIFTSPLNVAAYLDHWELPAGARVMALGPSTGSELVRRGVPCSWPVLPTDEELVKMLRHVV
ncbi:hypothetical protein LEM8419_01153 [Neolewinella maritima]|uniref:Tetrapyrrole biosynthesis uroporphyrinogen III synthase domain-containing protein n=1 Tax=Neolewinella maritima TaxID=1383882 RepID=A0ABM9AYQ2_9BACT|nr:uroporphyrinogen-III synthase [Neolewinella maritima]CAH0999891.1 hypothetical protein LEM8419_01153 [Neolewinella maritima]